MNRINESNQRTNESNQWIEPTNRINESKQRIESKNRIKESNQRIESKNRLKESNQWIETKNRDTQRHRETHRNIESKNRINESKAGDFLKRFRKSPCTQISTNNKSKTLSVRVLYWDNWLLLLSRSCLGSCGSLLGKNPPSLVQIRVRVSESPKNWFS